MPAKAKVTKEMILDAAFEIVRADGGNNINARTISQRLHCSTQPVLYHFSSIEEIRKETFKKIEQYHKEYYMDVQGQYDNPLLEIAMRYIRFAETEKNFFRYLFQSDYFENRDLTDWANEEKIEPVIKMMMDAVGITKQQAGDLFLSVYIVMHGYASMFAGNSLKYDETDIMRTLKRTFGGIVYSMKAELVAGQKKPQDDGKEIS